MIAVDVCRCWDGLKYIVYSYGESDSPINAKWWLNEHKCTQFKKNKEKYIPSICPSILGKNPKQRTKAIISFYEE